MADENTYVVTTQRLGQTFWLGGTVWRFSIERATRFSTQEEARRGLAKAKPFMAAEVYKRALIVPTFEE